LYSKYSDFFLHLDLNVYLLDVMNANSITTLAA